MSLNAIFSAYGDRARSEQMVSIADNGIAPSSRFWMRNIFNLPPATIGRAWYRSGCFAYRRLSAGRWQWRVGLCDVDQQGEAADLAGLIEQIERACGRTQSDAAEWVAQHGKGS